MRRSFVQTPQPVTAVVSYALGGTAPASVVSQFTFLACAIGDEKRTKSE